MRCDLPQSLNTNVSVKEHEESAKYSVTESCCEESTFMVNAIVIDIVAIWRFCAPVNGFTAAIWKIAEFSTKATNKFTIVTHAT